MNRININILLRISFLFFLSYVFGVFFHNIIHELGHAISVWIQGGTVTGFYFHPFNSSFNSSTYVPNHLLLYAGGAFFGSPLTILLMLLALKYRSPVMFPLIVTGTYSFFSTGIWMIKSTTAPQIVTDYTYMIEYGTPSFLLVIAGIIYIFFGLITRIFFLPLAGINNETTYKQRFIVYFAGILPWYILQGLFHVIFNKYSALSIIYLILPIIFYVSFEVLISLPLQRGIGLFRYIPVQKIRNYHFLIICVAIFILYLSGIFINILFPLKV